jgi:hypothetical protein
MHQLRQSRRQLAYAGVATAQLDIWCVAPIQYARGTHAASTQQCSIHPASTCCNGRRTTRPWHSRARCGNVLRGSRVAKAIGAGDATELCRHTHVNTLKTPHNRGNSLQRNLQPFCSECVFVTCSATFASCKGSFQPAACERHARIIGQKTVAELEVKKARRQVLSPRSATLWWTTVLSIVIRASHQQSARRRRDRGEREMGGREQEGANERKVRRLCLLSN